MCTTNSSSNSSSNSNTRCSDNHSSQLLRMLRPTNNSTHSPILSDGITCTQMAICIEVAAASPAADDDNDNDDDETKPHHPALHQTKAKKHT
mmetsp:Transcript_21503/g.59860  ORF Transcript_21503/g.59860 Transcript_21503/m.59860 type:complete len:92 (-) Transcript_21503:43-318(-)